MSDIGTINSALSETLLDKLLSLSNVPASDRLTKLQQQSKKLSSVLDYETLKSIKNGDYEFTLKSYTSLSTYNTLMNSLYGNNSASPFQQYLNRILGTDDDRFATAKSFVEKMRENGFSNASALKMYTAFNKYSMVSNIQNSNFVNAKV